MRARVPLAYIIAHAIPYVNSNIFREFMAVIFRENFIYRLTNFVAP